MLADVVFFGQTFDWHDLAIVGLLIVLEGVLSIDNALVLGLLAKRLPKSEQPRALTYGLVGAFVFRLIAIATASLLLKWRIVKLIGGGYLLYIAIKHLVFESRDKEEDEVVVGASGEPELRHVDTHTPLTEAEEEQEIRERVPIDFPGERQPTAAATKEPGRRAKFWPTVMVIELTDIAFAIDSILAAIALVGAPPANAPKDAFHPKLWVVLLGGMLGVILMRFAATLFIKLLDKFPNFDTAAYLLVAVIGGKLLADWGFNSPEHPHRVDFHDWRHPAFWTFWLLMIGAFAVGFIKRKKPAPTPNP